MTTLHNIDPHGTVNEPFLFRGIDRHGRLAVHELYRDLLCPQCGKLDEEAALNRGIPPGLKIRSKRPYLYSAEFIHLVDTRVKVVLNDLFADQIQFFEILSTGYWAAIAVDNFVPREGDAGYRFLKKCRTCSRYQELLFDRSVPAPIVRSKGTLVSIRLEGVYGIIGGWYVYNDTATYLDSIKHQLTGLVVVPRNFTEVP